MLPYLAGSAARREMQREFRGLNRRAGAAENEFAAMENMTGSQYPLLAPRDPRGKARGLKKLNGMLGGAAALGIAVLALEKRARKRRRKHKRRK